MWGEVYKKLFLMSATYDNLDSSLFLAELLLCMFPSRRRLSWLGEMKMSDDFEVCFLGFPIPL